jgi:GIY-YIG catalytic domain
MFPSNYKLCDFLCNNKDRRDRLLSSGIYSLKCSSCGFVYVGQSKRAIDVRWKEHNAHIKKNEPQKSSVALHFLENIDHILKKDDFNLEKCVSDPSKLDICEALYMRKFRHCLMNTTPANAESILLNLI